MCIRLSHSDLLLTSVMSNLSEVQDLQDEQGRMGKERRECVESVKGKGKMKVGRGKGGPASRKHMARRNPGREAQARNGEPRIPTPAFHF